MNTLDLNTLLNPSYKRPQSEAFPPDSVASLQEQSANRRQVSVEILRTKSEVDETGGQSEVSQLLGQYSGWLQPTTLPIEGQVGTGTESYSRYFMGVPYDADIRLDDRVATPGWADSWRPGRAYEKGNLCVPLSGNNGNGFIYLCAKTGVSSAIEPEWPSASGASFSDGTSSWINMGEIRYFEVIGDDSAQSTPAEKVVLVKEIR